jgi:hypothetical protein
MKPEDVIQMRQRLLDLPRLRVEDWYKYLENFFEFMPASMIGEIMNVSYPELITALAGLTTQGVPLERVAGILQGIGLMQTLHHAGMLKVEHAPLIEKPMVQ